MCSIRDKLKPGEKLPKFRRLYFLALEEQQQLNDILAFLVKYKIITKTDQNDKVENLFASPAYLVPKSNRQAPARMIVDLRILNSLINSPPAVHTSGHLSKFTQLSQ